MGMWEETCAITNTPIWAGDQAVLVVLDREELFCLFKREHGPKDPDSVPVRATAFGYYNFDFKALQAIHKGKYDSYGWIEGCKEGSDDPRRYKTKDDDNPFGSGFNITLFFHKDVWDGIVEFMRKPSFSEEMDDEITKEYTRNAKLNPIFLSDKKKPSEADIEEFVLVSRFAFLTRRDILSAHFFHGMQESDERLKDMHLFISEKIKEKAQHYEIDEEEPSLGELE